MSDFYNEQSDQHLVFEGAPVRLDGAVTIQGPKMHMFTQEPVIDIHDYAGRIYYGQSQFYTEPKEPRFVSQGSRPVSLILAGHFWYGTRPRFELGPGGEADPHGQQGGPGCGCGRRGDEIDGGRVGRPETPWRTGPTAGVGDNDRRLTVMLNG